MVLLPQTGTIEVKEWVPSNNLMPTNFIQKKPLKKQNKKQTNKNKQTNKKKNPKKKPICNFKILELIIDMIDNSTVNNKQLNTMSWALCTKMKPLSLKVRQFISVSFWTY